MLLQDMLQLLRRFHLTANEESLLGSASEDEFALDVNFSNSSPSKEHFSLSKELSADKIPFEGSKLEPNDLINELASCLQTALTNSSIHLKQIRDESQTKISLLTHENNEYVTKLQDKITENEFRNKELEKR